MAQLEVDNFEYATDGDAQAAYVSDTPANLEVYSEDTIKTQGDYSLKVIADTSSQGAILTHTLSPKSDLTSVNNLKFDIRSNVTGANVKASLYSGDGYDTETDLMLHYKMNDNAATDVVVDSSGNSRTGTSAANTDTVTVDPGKINRALSFNGTSDSINVTPFTFPTSGTINAWIYTKDANNAYPLRAILGSPLKIVDFGTIAGTTVYTGFYNSGTDNRITFSNSYLPLNTWTMLTLTWVDGGAMVVYVNGQQAGTTIATMTTYWDTATANSITLGGAGALDLDDFRIYGRVLSTADIAALYNTGSGTEAATNSQPVLVSEITPNIAVADQFQTVNWDISAVDDVDKADISKVEIEIVDATSANTAYVDNMNIATAIDVVGLIN